MPPFYCLFKYFSLYPFLYIISFRNIVFQNVGPTKGKKIMYFNNNTSDLFPIAAAWCLGMTKKGKKLWGLCKASHGGCSFFAWVAFREACYLADDKCLCTVSCLRTPAALKPWQPAQLQPATWTFNLSLSFSTSNQWQSSLAPVGGYLHRLHNKAYLLICDLMFIFAEISMIVWSPRGHQQDSERVMGRYWNHCDYCLCG